MSDILRHTFVTSDHHFGSWYSRGLFVTFTHEQEEELIEKWNMTVGKDDLVYYNGDFHDCILMDLCQYFSRLNGQIVLIKGNHDCLPDDIYKSIFKDVVDKVVLDDLDLLIHHQPGPSLGHREIFGHLHRFGYSGRGSPVSFCSCVQFHDGFPMSLEQIMLALK